MTFVEKRGHWNESSSIHRIPYVLENELTMENCLIGKAQGPAALCEDGKSLAVVVNFHL